MAHLQRRRAAEALRDAEALLAAEPGHQDAQVARRAALGLLGRLDRGDVVEGSFGGGLVEVTEHVQAGRFSEALAAADRLVMRWPGEASAWGLRGLARLAAGDATGALADLDQAVSRSRRPNSELREVRARALLALGRLDEALADADEALRLRPESPEGLVTRGKVHEARGDRERARADLRRAVEVAPGHPQAAQARRRLEALGP